MTDRVPAPDASRTDPRARDVADGRDGASRHAAAHAPIEAMQGARHALALQERVLLTDARRSLRNMRESVRLMALVLLVSVPMGVAAWAFLACLDAATAFREGHLWVFALLPVVGAGTAWLYRTHGKDAARGNNLVIDCTVTGRAIPSVMAPFTFICSVATHLAGGSAGREGTAVQIGGTIADFVSRHARLEPHDHQDLMMSGIAAAFGGVFGTPLAGAFFGMEMCFVGKLHYAAGIYCLVGSFVGNAVARLLGTAHAGYDIGAIPDLTPRVLLITVAAGVAFGVTARLFSAGIRFVRRFYAAHITSYLVSAVVSALILLAVYAAFNLYRYAGLSTWLVQEAFRGETTPVDAALKLAMTALTLGAGFQGGEVTPLFGIGASLGGWLGGLVHLAPSFMAALGLIGVFGSALNVPITTIMLGIDLFGGQAAPYFVIISFVGYLVAGHRGVYPAQRIVTPKWRSLAPDAGETVEEVIKQHREALERGTR